MADNMKGTGVTRRETTETIRRRSLTETIRRRSLTEIIRTRDMKSMGHIFTEV